MFIYKFVGVTSLDISHLDRWRYLFIFNFSTIVHQRKMDTPGRKRKREIQEAENDEFSFVFGTCGLHFKRRKKTSKSVLPFPKPPKQILPPARSDHSEVSFVFLYCLQK